MRRPFIAANWKMNMTIAETRDFLAHFVPAVQDVSDVDIIVAPPFTSMETAAKEISGTNVMLSAQNVFFEQKGAYTGEISPSMLVELGCTYTIVGHSERRQYFLEDDMIVNKKIKTAKNNGLDIILCIGESLTERETGKTFEVLKRQMEDGLNGVKLNGIVIAYEPIWAIGTGKTATPEQAQEVHAYIRGTLEAAYGNGVDNLCIIYGGSVTPENVDSRMSCRDVDGALVGGASLKVASFTRIFKFRKES